MVVVIPHFKKHPLVGGLEHVFIFNNIWDNPSHWLIFFKMVKTTNQIYKIIINQLIISNGCYLDHPPSHWLATKVENPVVFWDILINSSKEGMVFHAATGSISELYWVKPHIYKLKDVQKLIIP